MEANSSAVCAASTTNSPGTGRRETPSAQWASPVGPEGSPFLRARSYRRGRPSRDFGSPALSGRSGPMDALRQRFHKLPFDRRRSEALAVMVVLGYFAVALGS